MIVAVTGGKGGVGKSTIAWNLGGALESVVVDFDLTTPSLPRQRGPDLHDVLVSRASALAAVEAVSSVLVLPSGRGLAGARACNLRAVPDVLARLEREFGHVIVDCPAGLARDVGIALRAADVSVMVATPSQAAIHDATKTRELAMEVSTPVAAVVLNRGTGQPPTDVRKAMTEEFRAPVTVVPDDRSIERTIPNATPLSDLAPDSKGASRIETVAEYVRHCRGRPGDRTDRH